MAIITSSDELPVNIPPPPSIPGEWPTPEPSITTTSPDSASGLWVSPDFSVDMLQDQVNGTKQSLEVYIYQVTDTVLCNSLLALHKSGKNVTLVVSHDIYSSYDKNSARECYTMLYNAGLVARLAPSFFTYSHNKFWIVDGQVLGLSTGNWSPTDFNHPGYKNDWPAYNQYPSEWQDTNRDIQFWTNDSSVVDIFRTVIINDAAMGADFTPSW